MAESLYNLGEEGEKGREGRVAVFPTRGTTLKLDINRGLRGGYSISVGAVSFPKTLSRGTNINENSYR